ncbi:probable proteasome inhibitor isoform X1 [Pyrus x bretschneideri]|uniref:probable proteasome inhibitor isoform X1 n=1 Tax=Pyrus x bretschneideri TaxID=225117 RepID=UPI000870AA5B|nr:probable proteasome inhibitor isoform X1 [Pyrus x bretschneideri]
MANDKSVMAVIRAARPTFRNNDDKVAFAVHASFLAAGYVLTAVGPPAFSDSALSSSSTDEVGMEEWNELDGEYAFVYINPEKGSKKVLVKCLVMNGKLLVDALADGSSRPVHLEIDVGEYVGEDGGSNYSTQFKNLENLVKNLDTEVLSKLYGSASSTSGSSSNLESSERSERSTTEPVSGPSGFYTGPSGPYTDPSGIIYPPVMPYGGSDLLPGPGAGIYPSSLSGVVTVEACFLDPVTLVGLVALESLGLALIPLGQKVFHQVPVLIPMGPRVFLVLSLIDLQGIHGGGEVALIQIWSISAAAQISFRYAVQDMSFVIK